MKRNTALRDTGMRFCPGEGESSTSDVACGNCCGRLDVMGVCDGCVCLRALQYRETSCQKLSKLSYSSCLKKSYCSHDEQRRGDRIWSFLFSQVLG